MHTLGSMSTAFEILGVVSLIGAIDVLYFHLYRFRLYEQPASVAEQTTHLVRGLIFAAVLALVTFSAGSPMAAVALLGLAVLDLLNSAADVLLERGSREPLGGLPSVEYLLHVLATFGLGLATAFVWFHTDATGFTPLAGEGLYALRATVMIGLGLGLVLLEGGLFVRAIAARHRNALPAPA